MKLFRYRKPSLKRIVGLTSAKRAFKKATGISTIERYTKPNRIKQTIKQRVGLYSPTMTTIRQTLKGKIPMPLGIEPTKLDYKKTRSNKENLYTKSLHNEIKNGDRFSVKSETGDDVVCPKCGIIMGNPKSKSSFFGLKQTQYYECSNCNIKYEIIRR